MSQRTSEVIKMTMNELADKLNEWTDYYDWDNESLNDFANSYATSYEEYNAIWEILNELKIGAWQNPQSVIYYQ